VTIEPGVVGVVGRDVLEKAGQRREAKAGVAIDVAEVHASLSPEDPAVLGRRDEFLLHRSMLART
jgi:hypothetical protein